MKPKAHDEQSPPQEEMLNDALSMAMEWGDNFHKPIHERLHKQYPMLSQQELGDIDALCRKVMGFANDAIFDIAVKTGRTPENGDLWKAMRTHYPWVSGGNLSQLYTQAMYYAWRDLGFR